jgi:hypothetical protein
VPFKTLRHLSIYPPFWVQGAFGGPLLERLELKLVTGNSWIVHAIDTLARRDRKLYMYMHNVPDLQLDMSRLNQIRPLISSSDQSGLDRRITVAPHEHEKLVMPFHVQILRRHAEYCMLLDFFVSFKAREKIPGMALWCLVSYY